MSIFFLFFSSVHLSHPGRLYHSIAPWELLRRLPFVCCCVLPSLPILMLLLSLGSLSRLSSNMFDVSSFKFCLLICVGDIFSKHHFLSSFLPSRFPLKWPVAFHFSVCVCVCWYCVRSMLVLLLNIEHNIGRPCLKFICQLLWQCTTQQSLFYLFLSANHLRPFRWINLLCMHLSVA